MPETKYQVDTQRFVCTGLDLNAPIDMVREGKYPFLQNVRVTSFGEIINRPGVLALTAAGVVASQTPVHSMRRLTDPRSSTGAYVVGVGTVIATGAFAFTQRDTGYSGDPLALVPYRPENSPDPWMYIGDRSRMRKLKRDGTLHMIGLSAPANAPTAALGVPTYKTVSDFNTPGDFANAGDAGAAGAVVRVNTTVSQILYDTGSSGWACVNPASMDGIGVGAILEFDTGGADNEFKEVQEVPPGATATTVASVIYDSGSTGLCSVVLAVNVDQLEVNGLLRRTTATAENVRILSVNPGPDGTVSIRVSTTQTWAATDAVELLPSFRIYLSNTHAAAEDIDSSGVRSTLTFSTGQGTLTDTITLDLSQLSTSLAATPDDYMHISIRVDRPDLVVEGKIMLDVDSATNDYTRNFYTKSFRSADLTPAIRNQQTLLAARQTLLQRTIVDSPIVIRDTLPSNFNTLTFEDQVLTLQGLGYSNDDAVQLILSGVAQATAETQGGTPDTTGQFGSNTAVSQQLGLGDVQWTEVLFPLSELLKVGTDDSRTLRNVVSIRIQLEITGTVVLDLDSWWIGGGYGPDNSDPASSPYLYRFRARHPETNVAGNFSPALRGGIPLARRQSITVTPTQFPLPSGFSGAATDFVLDIERFGGANPSWHYAGTIPNAASPSFTDDLPDSTVSGNPELKNDNYQPWPVISIPATGTTGTVSGTTVNDSATGFNTSWAPGTRILVNDVPYTIYRVVSTSRLELVENAGSQSSVVWRIDEPLLLAQPLPCLWEFDDTFFACGDTTNPGRLYYSKRASESSQISFIDSDGKFYRWGYLDITSPSEPLMNGLPFNARNMLFSSNRMFQIRPTGNPVMPWTWEEIPNGIGLFSRWAFPMYGLKGEWIPFLGRDSVYKTDGGSPVSLTDRDLFPLFPNEGNTGANTNGVQAPSVSATNAASMRMEMYDGYVYFDYIDLAGSRRGLVYSVLLDGWFYDTPGVVFHYGDEGTDPGVNQAGGIHAIYVGGADVTTGILYQLTGNIDGAQAISCEVLTPSRDQGAPRASKLYGDVMVDLNPAGRTVTMAPTINNNTGTPPSSTSTSASSRTQVPVSTYVPASSSWQTARNIGLDITWSVIDTNRPKLYIWEPRWTFASAPISALSWEISPTTFGMRNFKSMGIYRITHISSVDLTLVVVVDGTAQTAITITNGSGAQVTTVGRFPVYKGKLYALRIYSTTAFRLDTRDSYFEIKEWANPNAYQELRVFSDYAMVEG